MKVHYVVEHRLSKLNAEVNRLLSEGWKLHGDMRINTFYERQICAGIPTDTRVFLYSQTLFHWEGDLG